MTEQNKGYCPTAPRTTPLPLRGRLWYALADAMKADPEKPLAQIICDAVQESDEQAVSRQLSPTGVYHADDYSVLNGLRTLYPKVATK